MKAGTQYAAAAAVLLFGAVLLQVSAGQTPSVRPSPQDKCPVCGMFVAGYKDFVAELVFADGSHAYFDGPKDMFRFYFEPEKYQPGRKQSDIVAVYVTDYYSLELIDGFQAFYVSGSDIRGPMGNELIPIAREAEAKTFLADHKGQTLFRFKEITLELVNGLD